MPHEEIIEEYKNFIQTQIKRYYWSVYLLIGLMDYLEKHKKFGFRFASHSRKMTAKKMEDKNVSKPKPDIILQSKDDKKGILIEVKTSYPENQYRFDRALEDDIKQLFAFDRDVVGWDTKTYKIDKYCIVLMPYSEGKAIRIPSLFLEYINESKVAFSHPFAIWYWSLDTSMKPSGEKIKIRNSKLGEGVGWEIGKFLKEDMIEININDLWQNYDKDKHRFGREPPETSIYTIISIYNMMGSYLRKGEDQKIRCTVEEIMNLAEIYLPSWLPDDEKKSQLRTKWVSRALEDLVKIGMAKKDKNYVYEWNEPQGKDFTGVLIGKMAKNKAKKQKHSLKHQDDSRTKTLDEFLNRKK